MGADRRAPVLTAFVLSLLLSVIAVAGSDDLNRDGMLYVDAARAFLDGGLESARTRFDWLFLPGLIAGLSSVTGLDPELAGYALCAVLLAATSALLVLHSEKVFGGTAWAACLVVLAIPAFNGYREYIIREYGFWCFTLLSAWLAMRWVEKPAWSAAVSGQVALCIAAAFRVEALVFLPVIIAWQLHASRGGQLRPRLTMLLALPLAALVLGASAYGFGMFDLRGRLAFYLSLIQESVLFASGVDELADSVLPDLSRDDAGIILFCGLVALVAVKFFKTLGLFLIPFLFAFRTPGVWSRAQPLSALFLAYLAVLGVFVTGMLFVTSRYVSFLNLLVVPVVAHGLMQMMRRWPGLKLPLVLLAVVVMLANVVSLSPKKHQYAEAGAWLRANLHDPQRAYVEGRRVRYHAGLEQEESPLSPADAVQEPLRSEFDLFVIEAPAERNAAALDAWRTEHDLDLIARFPGPGSEVLILAPRKGKAGAAGRR
ncbi:hypothetical protein [Thauera aromatica]|uniref:hypothetical protein n=1 Tax=Thauera aromatica TaxID=59405 RepID=UPI001FFD22C2|nr:hypothetical protein [Thauera aromatica]MCK2097012.1 hypothetical protein [Thauera aromatica]